MNGTEGITGSQPLNYNPAVNRGSIDETNSIELAKLNNTSNEAAGSPKEVAKEGGLKAFFMKLFSCFFKTPEEKEIQAKKQATENAIDEVVKDLNGSSLVGKRNCCFGLFSSEIKMGDFFKELVRNGDIKADPNLSKHDQERQLKYDFRDKIEDGTVRDITFSNKNEEVSKKDVRHSLGIIGNR